MDESTARIQAELEAELAQAHRRIAELEAELRQEGALWQAAQRHEPQHGVGIASHSVQDGERETAFPAAWDRAAELIIAQRDLARLANSDPALPKESVWSICLSQVEEVSGLDSGGLYSYDYDAHAFLLIHSNGLSPEFVSRIKRIGEENANAQRLMHGETLYFAESNLGAQVYRDEGLRSSAIVPILRHGEVLGCLNIASHTMSSIPEWSAYALEMLALEIGNIIIYQRTEEALAAESRRRQILFDESPAGIVILDPATARFLEFNTTAHRQLGYTREEFAALRLFDVEAKETEGETRSHIEDFIRNGIVEFETRHRTKQGEIRDVLVTSKIVDVLEQSLYYCTWRDITEQKRAQQGLCESEEKYRGLIDGMNDTICVIDDDARILDVNNAAITVLGYSREELLSMRITDLDASLPSEQIEGLIATMPKDKIQVFETRHKTKDGRIIPVEISSSLISYAGKTVIMSIARDITERKRVEKWLHDSRERMELALKGSDAAMWEWNVKTGESFFSERWARIIGFDPEELQPMSLEMWRSLCHPEDIELSIRYIKRHFAGETDYYQCEMRMRHKNGSWVWISDHGKVLEWDESGAPLRMFGTTVDITEAKREEHYTKARLRLANLFYEAPDPESIMRATLDEAKALTGSRIGFFHFVDEDQHTVSLQVWSDTTMSLPSRSAAQAGDRRYPVAQAWIWADSIQAREGRIYNDYMNFPGHQEFPEGHLPVSSFISIPILRNNLVVAVIGVGNKATVYDEHDLEVVKRFAEDSFDVILRKRTEAVLRESEEKYRGLMESLNNAVSTVDQEGNFLFMNDMAAENLGGTPRELIGRNIRKLFPEPYASQQVSVVQKVFQTDTEFVYETQSMIKGELRWYRVALQPLHNEWGEVTQVLVVVTDIHDLKLAQQELRDLNRTLEEKVAARSAEVQDLYDNAPAGYHSLDIEGRFIIVNQTELNWLGYSREEMLGHLVTDFLTEESRRIVKEVSQAIRERGWITDLELEYLRKDGSILPVALNSTAVRDASGRYVMSRSTIFDMTERKRAENERLRTMNFISALLDSIPTPVFYKDGEGRYLGCNRAYTEFTGFTLERISGKLPYEIMATRQSEAFRQEDIELMRNGGSRFYETTMHSRDGTQRPVMFFKNVFRDGNGEVAGLIGAFIDITERKHAEEALRQANQELERAMRMKDQFLATMSHELRTPLTGILGLSEALQMETYGSLNDKQRKTVKNIETSGRHLLALINDVLDLSKIEAGRLTLEVTRCALEDICQASLQLTKGMAQQRRQRVTYSVPIDPVLVAVDARRIKQVIVNLLSNAIKFTPEDGELGLTVESCGDDRNARVIVWDRGIGIRQENLSRLFQPFVQIDARLSREYTGTGLGLALVKKLLELHEGTVEVESVFGQGSRFIVTLPCVVIPEYPASPSLVASEVENPDPDVSDSSSPFVMVVDDNTLLLEMIADFLEATGYRAVRSQSGKDALEKLGEVAPDIILMDIQMPGMDGLEAIHRIRANPDSMIATIPIIAVTALAMPGDRERCLAAGANDYLTKPVKLMELATILKQLLPGRTAS